MILAYILFLGLVFVSVKAFFTNFANKVKWSAIVLAIWHNVRRR